MIGAPVEATLLIAKTEGVGVGVTNLLAFPTGLKLRVIAFARRSGGPELRFEDVGGWGPQRARRIREDQALPDEMLRFGIQFADGGKATAVRDDGPIFGPGRPDGPVLMTRGGGGDGRTWHEDYWLWPLPPPGPLAFVCEWPAYGIGLTRVEIEAEQVREAAANALAIWPEDEPFAEADEPWPPEGGTAGWTSYSSQ